MNMPTVNINSSRTENNEVKYKPDDYIDCFVGERS
jgi:hypothetical protein